MRSGLTLGGGTIASIVTPSLVILVPTVFGAGLLHGLSSTQWLLMVTLTWAAFNLARILGAGIDRIVSLFFWLYVYLFLGLAPLVQLEKDVFPLPGEYTEDQLFQSALIVLLGVAAYSLGRVARRGRSHLVGPIARFAARRIQYPRVRSLGVIALPLSFALVTSVGGVGVLLSSRQRLAEALGRQSTHEYGNDAASALISAGFTVPLFLAAALALGSRHALGRRFRHVFPVAWLVLIGAANIVFNNPFAHSRFWFGTVAVGFAALVLPLWRSVTFRLFAAVTIIALIVIFPYADRFRYETGDLKTELAFSETLTTNYDHDSFQEFANGIQYAEARGFTMGKQLLGVATFWVPRSLWEGKPIDTGPLVARHHGYTLENVSAPLWMEGYLNFGVAGTVVFLYAFARLSEALEAAWLARRQTRGGPQMIAVAVPAFAAYQMIILRGSLLQSMGRPVLMILVLLLCSRSSTPHRRMEVDTRPSSSLLTRQRTMR